MRRQSAEAGFFPPMVTSGANNSEEYDLIAGEAGEGTLVVADRRFDTPEFARFAADLRAAFGMEPDLRVTRGYASVKIWAQAVAIAGSAEGTAVAEALHSGTFRVFGIEARFDEAGNMQEPLGEPALSVWRQRRPLPLRPPQDRCPGPNKPAAASTDAFSSERARLTSSRWPAAAAAERAAPRTSD